MRNGLSAAPSHPSWQDRSARAELEGKIERASRPAGGHRPGQGVANADSKALARYLAALGHDVDADRISELSRATCGFAGGVRRRVVAHGRTCAIGAIASAAPGASVPVDHPGQSDHSLVHAGPATLASPLDHSTTLADHPDHSPGYGGRGVAGRLGGTDAHKPPEAGRNARSAAGHTIALMSCTGSRPPVRLR